MCIDVYGYIQMCTDVYRYGYPLSLIRNVYLNSLELVICVGFGT